MHVGGRTKLHANVTLQNCRVGTDCLLHSGVRIGADGFGFWVDTAGDVHKRPQLLRVLLGDHVEVGAGTCIDRGSWRDTMIGSHTKIDNQVQIGHNCQLGRFVVLCAQVGLAGSTIVGDGAVLGGRAASVGHLRIGAGARMAGAAVATKDIADGATVGGYPAWDLKNETRVLARLRRMIRD